MPLRSRHPQLRAVICLLYGIAVRLYPRDFRRAFGADLALTFRNRVDDVLNDGGVGDWLHFAVHVTRDWLQTCAAQMLASGSNASASSILGLADGDVASGSLCRTALDSGLVFAAAGLVVALLGWYWYFVVLPPLVHV